MNDPTRVLMIEDDEEVVALMKARFSFEDGIDLRVIDRDFEHVGPEDFIDVDLVVLDLWLTDNGFTENYPMAHRVMRAAKQYDRLLPVIVFSAVVGLHHSPDLELEADAVIRKHDLERLVDSIVAITGRRRRPSGHA